MAIASFGGKTFKAGVSKSFTFSDFQHTSALQTEKQDALGKKPSTYNKGPDLDTFSIKINLNVFFGVNPKKEWNDWIRLKDSGKAYPFILGTKPLGSNKYQVVNVSTSDVNIDTKGNILKMDLMLQFNEYVRPGKASYSNSTESWYSEAAGLGSKKSTKKTSSKKTSTTSNAALNQLSSLVDENYKAQNKRQNASMQGGKK